MSAAAEVRTTSAAADVRPAWLTRPQACLVPAHKGDHGRYGRRGCGSVRFCACGSVKKERDAGVVGLAVAAKGVFDLASALLKVI